MIKSTNIPFLLSLGGLVVLGSCGGGGGSGSGPASQGGFQLVDISVPANAIWKINRPIDFTFNVPINFASISLNTIQIRDESGVPVTGSFTLNSDSTDPLVKDKIVTFQPTCPLKADLSDAGLQPLGKTYTILVFGKDSGSSLTVLSSTGSALTTSQSRSFKTPNSLQPDQVFFDPIVGPPSPVVHQPTSAPDDPGTYLQIGGDPDNRVYFEFDPQTQTFSTPSDVPLNLYSDSSTEIAVYLELDQPVNPLGDNISTNNLRLEFFDNSSLTWNPVPATVELLSNCTASGATVRIQPTGILPPSSAMRIVLTSSFEDLGGDKNLLDVSNFGVFETTVQTFPSLTPPDDLADELHEPFDVGGTAFGSLQDTSTGFAEPLASWGNGKLKPAFGFTGTGGVDGAFDWVISSNTTLDVGAATIFGGDIGSNPETAPYVQSKSQTIVGGLINVRHMRVEPGATLRVIGSSPMVIQATGKVIINGTIDITGFDSQDVATLDTGHVPEAGGAGVAGGGLGGTGNFLTTTSTPVGGNGAGAFNVPNLGGLGGESGYDPTGGTGVANRRPGGGGGGALGAAESQGIQGLAAKKGQNGGTAAFGALSGQAPPQGGQAGPRPFFDGLNTNDFFGTKFDSVTGTATLGELDAPTAGTGGGAGGNACAGPTFPTPNWQISSDEKGGGGGGGGGSIQILALDTIKFGVNGRLDAGGGDGASGENTNGTNHVGGGSGGGSGGHVILQAGKKIDFSATSADDVVTAKGGRWGNGETAVETAKNAGGSGGPGIIQLHTLGGAADILLPVGKTLATRTAPDPILLVPAFGSRSKTISKWIPLGGAGFDPQGGFSAIKFYFEGIDTTTGLVKKTNNIVDDASNILPSPLTLAPGDIQVDGYTVVFDASSITGDSDIFLRNANLLKDCKLRLQQTSNPNFKKDFDIATASYDAQAQELTVSVSASGSALTTFNPGVGQTTDLRLIRRFFRVATNGSNDILPDSATIRISFDAAKAKTDGTPDTAALLVTDAKDISALNNGTLLGQIAFFRFQVLFDIDANSQGLSPQSARPELDFLRIPFRF